MDIVSNFKKVADKTYDFPADEKYEFFNFKWDFFFYFKERNTQRIQKIYFLDFARVMPNFMGKKVFEY